MCSPANGVACIISGQYSCWGVFKTGPGLKRVFTVDYKQMAHRGIVRGKSLERRGGFDKASQGQQREYMEGLTEAGQGYAI
jgi:hypothetical protein